MSYVNKIDNEVLEIQLPERFTFNDNQAFRAAISGLEGTAVKQVVLNVEKTQFMDSAGLGMLLVAKDEAEKNNKQIRLKSPQGYVKKLFTISRFHDVFHIDD